MQCNGQDLCIRLIPSRIASWKTSFLPSLAFACCMPQRSLGSLIIGVMLLLVSSSLEGRPVVWQMLRVHG